MNVLTLSPSAASWPFERGVFRKKIVDVRREFVDLLVDGKSLRQWFDSDRSGKLMPPLSSEDKEDAAFAVATLDALLGDVTGPYQDGCAPLLICGMDNDVYCGALGVRVEIQSEIVGWNVGWHFLGPDGSVEAHEEPGSSEPTQFVFDRHEYEGLLRPARERFRAVAQGAVAYPFVPPLRKP